MPLTAQQQLYPFSAQNSQTIPLDIIRPLGVIVRDFAYEVESAIVFPEGMAVASFYSDVPCFVAFGAETGFSVVGEAYNQDVLFVPRSTTIVSVVTAAHALVLPMGAVSGTLIIQHIHQWASVALPREISKKI